MKLIIEELTEGWIIHREEMTQNTEKEAVCGLQGKYPVPVKKVSLEPSSDMIE